MKQFVTFLIIILCSSVEAKAQNFLQHLQQVTPGLGTVTISQSKAIDELVNGKTITPQNVKQKTTPEVHKNNTNELHKKTEPLKKPIVAERESTSKATTSEQKKTTQIPDSMKKQEQHEEEAETPTVDMRKKVMRSSYKVTGYRVQAFAGGNSRNDRLKAEQIGNAIKMKHPELPVYVHFYSPRWICRVGNFRSLAEAQKMLNKVRAMGYSQACLVKGQITVQN